MWEKTDGIDNTEKKKILFPIRPDFKGEKTSPILFIQIAICVIFVLVAFAFASVNEKNKLEISKYADYLINQGIGETDEIARLVSSFIDNISKASQNTTQQGGFNGVKSNAITPPNCTFNNYKISQMPTIPVKGTVTSSFGNRINPINKKDDFHTGIDIAAKRNTAVLSAFDGIIIETGTNKIRGNYVFIRHANNLVTQYSHLNYIFKKQGETVNAGDIIGGVGTSGMSTGYHLHFEILIDDIYVNPFNVLNLPVRQAL